MTASTSSTWSTTSGLVRSMRGEADRDLLLEVLGEAAHDHGGPVGRHVGEHQRDGLGVLVLEERQDLAGVGVLEELEGHVEAALGDPVEDLVGLVARRRVSFSSSRARSRPPEVIVDVGVGQVLELARGPPRRSSASTSRSRATSAMTSATSDSRISRSTLAAAPCPCGGGGRRPSAAPLGVVGRSWPSAPPVSEPGAQHGGDVFGLAVDEVADLVLQHHVARCAGRVELRRARAAWRRRRRVPPSISPARSASSDGGLLGGVGQRDGHRVLGRCSTSWRCGRPGAAR